MSAFYVLRESCDQCPWKGRLELRPGRLLSIIRDCERRDTHFICHKTIRDHFPDTPTPDAVCAGWREAAEHRGHVPGQLWRIMERLGAVEEVDAP